MHQASKSGALVAAAAAAMLLAGPVQARAAAHAVSTAHGSELNGCGGMVVGGSGSSSPSETPARKEARLVREAKQGGAAAQNALGLRYERGVDVAANGAKAAEWYRMAADQGLADAQNNLGRMYYNGSGIAQDVRMAATWFEKAAAQGDATAAALLGVLYARGDKLDKDIGKAAMWTAKAASLGNAAAQYELGVFHLNGQGVKKDMLEAYKWFVIAEAGGHQGARQARQSIEPNLTSEEIADLQAQAKASTRKADKAAI